MQKTETVAARVTSDIAERLKKLAASLDRKPSYIIEKALEAYLDEYDAEVTLIQDRLAEAQRPDAVLIPHNEIDVWIAQRRARDS